jgi:hypothetical protein
MTLEKKRKKKRKNKKKDKKKLTCVPRLQCLYDPRDRSYS